MAPIIKELFLFLSNILVLVAYFVYIRAILRGQAKPHRTTRLVLLLITGLATASLFAAGNDVAVWLAGSMSVMSAVIFLLSLKYGMGGWDRLDILCLGIALAGIVVWMVTDNPALALLSSVIADFTGVVPTLVKSYFQPKTEVWTFFALGAAASFFNLLAIKNLTFAEFIYPLYLFLINGVLVAFILRGGIRKRANGSGTNN